MAPIDDALAEVNSYKPGEKISFQKISNKHGVVRSTLTRRHQGLHQSREIRAIKQRTIIPQQEEALVKYIEGLIERQLPPKRETIKCFASVLAKRPVSDSWVSRFINRNKDRLTPQRTTGIETKTHSSQEERTVVDKAEKAKEAKAKEAKAKEAKEKEAKEKEAKEKEAKEKENKERKAKKEEEAKEKRAKAKEAKEEAKEKKVKERKAKKEEEAKEKRAKEKEAKEKKAKERKVKKEEKAKREKEAKKEKGKVKAIRAKQAAEPAGQQEAQNRARGAENALELPQTGKRKASQPSTHKSKRQKRVDAGSGANAAEKLSAAPAITTRRGRNIKLPSRYK